MNNKIPILPFWLWSDFRISGSEDKSLNVVIKDAPIAVIAQESPWVLRAVSQELWMKSKIYIYYKSQYQWFNLVSLESRAWDKGFCVVTYFGKWSQGTGLGHWEKWKTHEGKMIFDLFISWSPLGLYLAGNPLKSLIERTSESLKVFIGWGVILWYWSTHSSKN